MVGLKVIGLDRGDRYFLTSKRRFSGKLFFTEKVNDGWINDLCWLHHCSRCGYKGSVGGQLYSEC